MAKKPRAAWTGVLAFPELGIDLDCWLYASQRRGRIPLPVVMIHTSCKTSLASPPEPPKPEEKEGEDKEEKPAEGAPSPAPVTAAIAAFHCPRCNRPLKSDEVGRAVETETLGLVPISDAEYAGLKVVAAKRAGAQIVVDPASVIASLGLGRRLWVFPKPVSVGDYFLLLEALRRSGRVAFVPEIVVGKRPYVLVVRPLETDEAVHGTTLSVLVADEFNDTDTLRSPADFELLPTSPPAIDGTRVTILAERAAAITARVNLSVCVNPVRRKFRELVARKVAAQRVL